LVEAKLQRFHQSLTLAGFGGFDFVGELDLPQFRLVRPGNLTAP
jgi:hypothetical protein